MATTSLARAIATFGYVGYLRPAPGTWGSLAAAVLAPLIHLVGGWFLLLVMAACAFAAGLWAARRETGPGREDPSEIVIDEVAGQWIALLPWALIVTPERALSAEALGWVAAAFLAFRLFDIWKPWLVGRMDARHDALGLMADDAVAGVFAWVVYLPAVVLALFFASAVTPA
ncbi:MAG: phosphatidylglycerophosphatase A [Pseudomonadota bacterium]